MANGQIIVTFQNSNDIVNPSQSSAEDVMNENGNDIYNFGKSTTNNSNKSSLVKTLAIQTGKSLFNYGLSVFGDLTGNYVLENKINDAINIASTAAMLATFPVGTIAAVTQITTSTISSFINQNKSNLETNLLRSRTGNSTLNNSMEGFD